MLAEARSACRPPVSSNRAASADYQRQTIRPKHFDTARLC